MKYRLTENKKEWLGHTLYQIEALRNFGNVKKGDLGGWIEKEENLSQDGDARVYGDAWVYDNAQVYGDARVYGDAWVYGNACVCDNAWVYGNVDILWIPNIGSRLDTTSAFKNKNGGVSVKCGCFLGELNEFAAKVEETHANNVYGREYKALIELIKIHFGVKENV